MSIVSLIIIAGLYFLAALDLLAHEDYAKAAMVFFWGCGNLAIVFDLYTSP